MDPQACFARITDALSEDDFEEASYGCDDMIDWLAKGGFEPLIYNGHAVPIAFFRNLRRMLGALVQIRYPGSLA